jgi:hypothetical protein
MKIHQAAGRNILQAESFRYGGNEIKWTEIVTEV